VRFVVQQPKAVQLSVQLFSVSSEIGVHKIFSRCIFVIFGRSSNLGFWRLALGEVRCVLGAYSTAVAIWRLLPAQSKAGYIQFAEVAAQLGQQGLTQRSGEVSSRAT
jgi:hypothetical protein